MSKHLPVCAASAESIRFIPLIVVVITLALFFTGIPRSAIRPEIPGKMTYGSATTREGFAGSSHKSEDSKQAHLAECYGKLPLSFEINRGQADSRVKFISRGSGYSMFLTATETILALQPTGSYSQANSRSEEAKSTLLRITLVGANSAPAIEGQQELPGKSSYLIGSASQQWRTAIPTFSKVMYSEVYSGIDMVYYGNQQELEYDFIVAPGADPQVIRLAFGGSDKVSTDKSGELMVETSNRKVRQYRPTVYQGEGDSKKLIACKYSLKGEREIGFDVGAYDPSKPLIIDPVLSYSTFLGGTAQDAPEDIAVDSEGNAYVAGWTFSYDFPITPGAFSTIRGAFVSKMNSTGTALLYSTFIEATNQIVVASSVAVDPGGNAYLTGYTTGGFPTTPGAFQRNFLSHFRSAFVTKLNPTGTGLVYSTYLGGNEADQAWAIAVDSAGNAYVTGSTYAIAPLVAQFPVTLGAFQTVYAGGFDRFGGDAFVTKVNATGTGLLYSTYLGGRYDDSCSCLAVDSNGCAYVGGWTDSRDFPTTPGSYQPQPNESSRQAFIAKMSPAGDALAYSTYFHNAWVQGIAVDAFSHAYVSGSAISGFNTTPGAYQVTCAGGNDGYVAKLNSTGAALIYATFIGGSNDDLGQAIALDSAGNAYITGQTSSSNYPTTPDAFQQHLNYIWTDVFFSKLNASGTGLIYSTYMGGFSVDYARSVAVDTFGNAYLTGEAGSADFPTTAGSFQPTFNGNSFTDGFIAKFSGLAPFDLCIQDDSSGNILRVNSTTGDYQFTNCSGFTMTGTGTLIKRGGMITLQDNASDRRVLAKVDTSVQKGTASVQLLSQGIVFTIIDRNTTNNTCVCIAP